MHDILGKHQRFYDSVVDGLRRQGWSRYEAESEALDRVETLREKERQCDTRSSTTPPLPGC